MTDLARDVDRFVPPPLTFAWAGLVVTTEFLFVASYVFSVDSKVTSPVLLALPFVWINLAIWVFVRIRPAPSSGGRHWGAVAVAIGYFALLSYVGGIVTPGGQFASGFRIAATSLPPGWGPALLYDGQVVDLALLPYKVVGYLALAYLVYVTIRDVSGAIVGSLIGMLSCVSCTFPLIVGLVAAFTGSTSALATVVYLNSYLLSAGAFAVAVGVLAWRPRLTSFGRLLAS